MITAAQIAYLVLIVPVAVAGTFLGFMIAIPGIDLFEKGRRYAGTLRFAVGGTVTLGSCGVLPHLGYWLTFEGGIEHMAEAVRRMG